MPTAMILAAGRGERMRPLTEQTPKPLIAVAGRPLIEHHLAKLVAAGIRHVVINVSYLGDRIMAALGDGARFGCEIAYSAEPVPLESGGGVATAAPLFRSEAVLLVSADIWSDFDYRRLVERAHAIAAGEVDAHFVLVPRTAQAPGGEFSLTDGRVTEGEPRHTLANLSVLARRQIVAWPRNEAFRLYPYYRRWVAAGRVSGELHSGDWINVTTPQDVEYLNQRHRAPARM